MTDFTKLVSSDEWSEIREKVRAALRSIPATSCADVDDYMNRAVCAALSAFLTAAVEKGVARMGAASVSPSEKWEAWAPSTVLRHDFPVIIIKTGDK